MTFATAPSSARQPQSTFSRSGVAAAVFGNMLEFYDFTVYAFFAVWIGKAFFPTQDPFSSLLLSVATFGVGFVTRPVGAAYIGAYADRAGRKPAMLLTIVLMAIGTLVVALTPGYATIGIAAPVIVVLARLVQGFALGGDVGPASAILIENAPAERRGLIGAWQIASQGASTLIAGLIGIALTSSLPVEAMQAWGWRAAFLIGLLVVPVGIVMRRAMPETLHPSPTDVPTTRSVGRLFKEHGRTITLGVLVVMAGTITTYTSNYLTTYALTTLHMAPSIAIGATAVVGLSTLLGALLGGWLSDRFGRKALTAIPRLLTIVIVYPVFLTMTLYPSPTVFYAMAATLSATNALGVGVVFIAESFPKPIRAVGLAITYAIGISVFGGTTQFVVAWLIRITQDPRSPAWYVAATGIAGFIATLLLPNTGINADGRSA